MSVRKHHISRDGIAGVEVRNAAGSVVVEAVQGADMVQIRIEPLDDAAEQLLDQVQVDVDVVDLDRVGSPSWVRVIAPQRRLLRTPSFAITLRTPPGLDARIAVASADTELRGRLGRVVLTGASGDADVEDCAELQGRTASGDVRARRVGGAATVGTASGDVRLDAAGGAVEVRTASGTVTVGEPAGELNVKTASGDVTVGRLVTGTARLTTVSGDASATVAAGLRVWLDLQTVSGRLESHLEDDAAGDGPAQLSLSMRSVSGDLRISRVPPAPAG